VKELIRPSRVLMGANKEHLNTGLPTFHMQTDHIALADSAWIDALRGLDLGHGADAVAQTGSYLKFHRVRRRLHLFCEALLHPRILALKESLGVIHQGGVILF